MQVIAEDGITGRPLYMSVPVLVIVYEKIIK